MSEQFDPYHKWLGIRPEEQPPSHYRLLGISPFEDDQDSIANAADQRMAHIRSFQMGKYAALSQKLLNEISSAKVCLLNAAKKAAYDEQLRRTSAPSIPKAHIARARPLEVMTVESPVSPEQPAQAFDFIAEPSFHKKHKEGYSKKNLPLLIVVAILAIVLAGVASWFVMRHYGSKESDELVVAQPNEVKAPPPAPTQAKPATTIAKPAPKSDPPKPPSNVAAAKRVEPDVKPPVVPDTVVPKVDAPSPKPRADSATTNPPEASHENQGESLSEAAKQLEKAVAAAANADDYRDLAKRGIALANRAIAESDGAIAKTAIKESLTAARKSGDSELVKEATLLLIRLQSLPSHGRD